MSADGHHARRSTVVCAFRRAAIASLVCLALAPGSRAETIEYSWNVPDRQRVNYEVPFEVLYDGDMTVDVEWAGGRVLAFRLDGPGELRVRRSGPSPQRLEAEVGPIASGTPATYVLHISGLPATGSGDGMLRVELPDAPDVVAAREAAARPAPPPPPEPKPWMVPVAAPAGSAPDRVLLFDAVEELRSGLVDEVEWTLGADPCRWQEGALRYLGALRDRIGAGAGPPDIGTRRYFRQLASATDDVEAFRRSDDPLLAGPVPDDPSRRRVWLMVREQRTRPLERELDRLLINIEDGFVPELESEDWPRKLISCVMACQRHFDEVVLEGPENAGNARLAETEWALLRAASRAFEAVSMLSATDGNPTP